MTLLFMGLAALLAVIAIKKIYKKSWSKNLECGIELSADRAFPGDRLYITETITNRKWLPLPIIKVKLEVDRSLVFDGVVENTNVSDKCYKSDVFSVLFYQRIVKKLPFVCLRRGYFSIDRIDLVSTDVMMDETLASVIHAGKSLAVYPAILSEDETDIPFKRLLGTILTRKYSYEDPFEFRGIREYQTYDTMKSINWNASAKTGELKVNLHDYTTNRQVCFLLNVENEGVLVHDELKEYSISLVATLAGKLIKEGIGVSVVSNGRDKVTGEELVVESGCDMSHMETILYSLARIDTKAEVREFADCIESSEKLSEDGNIFVLVSASKREALQKSYGRLKTDNPDSMWICPINNYMDREMKYYDAGDVVFVELQK